MNPKVGYMETQTMNEETKPETADAAAETSPEAMAEEQTQQAQESESSEESSASSAEVEQLKQYKDKYYYLAAEMENSRKRFERDKTNLVKFGNESILKDLVDVMDNFDRTVDALKADNDDKVKNIVVGIEMVRKQFADVLNKSGLSEVEAAGKFDPNFHEAMTQEEREGTESGTITQVFQKGYSLNGRLIRAAKVVVAK